MRGFYAGLPFREREKTGRVLGLGGILVRVRVDEYIERSTMRGIGNV
jgi:hypothetical protein